MSSRFPNGVDIDDTTHRTFDLNIKAPIEYRDAFVHLVQDTTAGRPDLIAHMRVYQHIAWQAGLDLAAVEPERVRRFVCAVNAIWIASRATSRSTL